MKNIQFIEGPLSPDLVSKLLQQHMQIVATGAYTIFCGQVRADVVESQLVEGIEYTVYEPMAHKILDEQLQSIQQQFNLQNITLIHSKGFVNAGGLSIILFITSSHRNQALEAQQTLLPIIKFEIPIWKKEIFKNLSTRWT